VTTRRYLVNNFLSKISQRLYVKNYARKIVKICVIYVNEILVVVVKMIANYCVTLYLNYTPVRVLASLQLAHSVIRVFDSL